jgi:hypothetical protein
MEVFGKLEEFGSELYPYRYPIGIVLVAAVAAAAYAGYRMGWHRVLWQHRRLSLAIVAPLLVVMSFVAYYTLSPLWERSTLIEASPLVVAAGSETPAVTATGNPATPTSAPTATASAQRPSPASTPAPPATAAGGAAFDARVVSEGTWVGADDFHFARGKALLIETEPGKFVVRVEEFSVRNGPDLFVYLSPSADGFADGALNLGGLKATDGAFNYEVPEGTDVGQFKSVVVWCRQFAVLFGTATLGAP